MLLPHMWLRKLWLKRALRDYPLYDPPHKIEERLLSKEKAAENFDYFMGVRQRRVAYFRDWLRRYFWVSVSPDEKGVRALNRWGNKYAGILLVLGPDGHPTLSYVTYDPPWTGNYAGYNVLFDMGIVFGEFLIANCPKLHWDFDPISAILPRRAKMLKRTPGMGFQRPRLTGFDAPISEAIPLHNVEEFAYLMMRNLTTFEGLSSLYSEPRGMRRNVTDQLVNIFRETLRHYPAGDPFKLREQIGPDEYLKFIDLEYEDEDDGDE
jgi:hypothetical protein